MELRDRVALVTGGAHRLGRAITLALGQAGARVVINYNQSEEKAQATLADLNQLGAEGHLVAGNLSEVATVERVVDEAIAHWGRLDLLVNNAGIWGRTPIGEVTPERWDALMATNLRAAFFAVQRAAPALRAAGGAIINVADVGVFSPWRNYTPYLVSKGGVVTLTETLAKDLAPEVRVNAVAPGPVLLPEDWSEEQAEQTIRTVPLRRLGTAEDIAQAVLFLAQASYVTGVVLPVDGGQRFGP